MKRISFIPAGLILSVLVSLMLGGCIDERYTENAPLGDEVQLLVELNVPGVSTAAVRGFSPGTEEDKIEKLDVLVFYGGTETFAYKTHGVPESGKYKVNLKKSTEDETYTFVFLANLREEVTAAMNGLSLPTTKTKAQILKDITFSVSSAWTTTGTDVRYLPMWGESATAHTVNASLIIPKVSMLRSVARVDILMNPDPLASPSDPKATGGFTNHRLASVKVHNASILGAAVPNVTVDDLPTEVGTVGVTTPTIPIGATRAANPITYTSTTNDQKKFGMRRDIYIAEAADAQITDESKMTCLVIEITDNGQSSWYRLDFVKEQDTGLRWDILRNYCYAFKIIAITGQGYASADIALVAPPANLEYEIIVSNESDDESAIKEVVFNGQYMLGVSQKSFAFSYEERTEDSDDNTLYIETNYDRGWTVTNDNNWLGIVDETGDPITEGTEGITKVKLVFSENTTAVPYTGDIYVSLANGLNVTIAVMQDAPLAEANCYMVAPGSSGIKFTANRAYAPIGGATAGEQLFVTLLWDDANCISTLAIEGTSTVLVTPTSNAGNAVIAVRTGSLSGPIVWSYHIWVTDYTAPSSSWWTANGTSTNANKTFMDRNLGASEAANSLAGRGLYYQWGRKDPFPGGTDGMAGFAALNKFSGMPGSGSTTTATITSAMAASTAAAVLVSIKNPTMFYIYNTNNGNWFSLVDAAANLLWGATKTVYDPCPTGWRVPTSGVAAASSPWYGLATPSFSDGNTGGATWSGSFWPAAGRRNFSSGAFANAGGNGYYWSASVTGVSGYDLFFSTNSVSPNTNTNRAYGLSVRCVRE